MTFSHPQRATLVEEFTGRLGNGLRAKNSTNEYLHVDLRVTSPIKLAGWLGQEGWELVSHAVLTGGHEYWTFMRENQTRG